MFTIPALSYISWFIDGAIFLIHLFCIGWVLKCVVYLPKDVLQMIGLYQSEEWQRFRTEVVVFITYWAFSALIVFYFFYRFWDQVQ